MAKISVVDAAKKAKLEPEEFMKKLQEFGIYVEDVQSTFDSSKLSQVLSLLKDNHKPSVNKVEKRISSGVVRRRRTKKKKAQAEPVEEAVQADQDEGAFEEISEVPDEETHVSEEPIENVPAEETEIVAEDLTEGAEDDIQETESGEEPDQVEIPLEELAEDQIKTEEIKAREDDSGGKRGKKKDKRTKRLPIRGVTREPARILSKPDHKIDTLKPEFTVEEDAAKKTPPADKEKAKETRGKRGRRVVEMGRRGSGRKHRKKEVFERGLYGRKKKREQKSTEITVPKAIKRKIKIMEQVQVGELAHRMGMKAGDLIGKLIGMGVMATINQYIDYDTAVIITEDYGFEIENISVDEDDIFKMDETDKTDKKQEPRPPVVTVMGHVDHGKTTLLDTIRQANVVDREMGGITQHIGAYNVRLEKGNVIFLDTPGHETFTAMRARGAQVTDIVILIVAADDGVMPQTVEAINHSRDANVPIIVAVNKIDKPGADPDRVKNALAEYELIPEDWGGETQFAEVSAKKGEGIQDLLEMILLQAEIMELTAVRDIPATGFILESRLEKGRGPVATVLINEGTLKVGDPIVSDIHWGRVRSMLDDLGQNIDIATPSMPVEVLGLAGVPVAGSTFNATTGEKLAKQVAELREKKVRERDQKKLAKVSLEDFYSTIQEGEVKELKLIVKADVQGSVEAINEAVVKLSNDEVKVKVIHSGAGAISETDINFAIASNAIVVGFNVRPEPKSRALAEREHIDIKLYEVIYDLVKDIRDALEGMLAPTIQEEVLGRAEVRDTFHISRIGTIAGCYVTDGKLLRNCKCRLIRDGVVIFNGKINSLKRFKDDAKEVASGFECGIGIEGFNDIKVGDQIEGFELHEIATKLK